MDYALNSPKHTQTHTYPYTPYATQSVACVIFLPSFLWCLSKPHHRVTGMCERQKQSTTTIHCFLDSNQWTVFAYSQFIAFFCLAGTDLSVIWAAVGALVTLTTRSALCLCWCAVKPAAAVSFVAAKLKKCSNRLPHVLPLATCAGSPGRPARSFRCLSSCPQTSHHQQWPEATRHLLHERCWFYWQNTAPLGYGPLRVSIMMKTTNYNSHRWDSLHMWRKHS